MLSSTPQCQLQFDSGGTTFLHLLVPAFFVSIIVTSTSGYHPIFPRLFRSSLLVSIDTTSTLSLSLQLPQLRRHSFPSLPLSLLRSSFFVSIVQTPTSFLISHHLSHSTPASEVSKFFPWKQLSVHLVPRTWQLERRKLWPRLVLQ